MTVDIDHAEDEMLSEILHAHQRLICRYHPHHSLLVNNVCEELDDGTKYDAWMVYLRQLERERTPLRIHNRNVTIHDSETAIQRRPAYTIYGFNKLLFPDVLATKALDLDPNASDERIWCELVPEVLYDLYDQMDDGNTQVNILIFGRFF